MTIRHILGTPDKPYRVEKLNDTAAGIIGWSTVATALQPGTTGEIYLELCGVAYRITVDKFQPELEKWLEEKNCDWYRQLRLKS